MGRRGLGGAFDNIKVFCTPPTSTLKELFYRKDSWVDMPNVFVYYRIKFLILNLSAVFHSSLLYSGTNSVTKTNGSWTQIYNNVYTHHYV